MKNHHFLGLISLMMAILSAPASASISEIGQVAPDFALSDIEGRVHNLSDYHGKVVVLEWVNPECPFVQKHYESGNIPQLQKSAIADGAVWLVINSGHPGAQGDFTPAEVKVWQKKTGSEPTAYFRDQDGAIGRLYGAKATPHMYVISEDGILKYNGAIDSIRSSNPKDIAKAENYVISALNAMNSGDEIKHPVTRPYGCSVKY